MEQSYKEKYEDILARLERAKNDNEVCDERFCCVIDDLIPELAESEDEKVRKELTKHLKELSDWKEDEVIPVKNPSYYRQWASWLERQGEHANFRNKIQVGDKVTRNENGVLVNLSQLKRVAKPSEKQCEQQASYTTIVETGDGGINALVTRELPIDGCDNEQNPDDKVEPEFNVGDWIVQNGVNRNPVQITSFEEDKGVGIKVWFSNDTGTYVDFLKGYHKWTIQDAKDGDVLISKYGSMCIFKDNKSCYCYIDTKHENFYAKNNRWFSTDYTLKPATKEQRDLLFQKMHEAGYTFDFEKKELKKIEPKTKENKGNIGGISSNWSENDEEALEMAIIALEDMYDDDTPNTTYGGHYMPFDKAANQLKSLKGRVQPQNTWKPSEEQLNNILDVLSFDNCTPKRQELLISLYEQLKKLK